jgi:hypothetical protein
MLTQGEHLQREIRPTAEEDANGSGDRDDECEHQHRFSTHGWELTGNTRGQKLLNSKAERILATHRRVCPQDPVLGGEIFDLQQEFLIDEPDT